MIFGIFCCTVTQRQDISVISLLFPFVPLHKLDMLKNLEFLRFKEKASR